MLLAAAGLLLCCCRLSPRLLLLSHGLDNPDLMGAALAEKRGGYSRLIHHDLQNIPLPAGDDAYDAAASVGVLTYIQDAEALFRDLCRCVRPAGAIAFTQRSDLWEERMFPQIISRLETEGLWQNRHVSRPRAYLPGNEDFADDVRGIHTLWLVL